MANDDVWVVLQDHGEGGPDLMGIFRSAQAAASWCELDAHNTQLTRERDHIRVHGRRVPGHGGFVPLLWYPLHIDWDGAECWASDNYEIRVEPIRTL